MKRLLMPMLAAIIIAAMVVPGCGGTTTPTTYDLTVTSTVGGSVATPGEDVYKYAKDTEVRLIALAVAGYEFDSWTAEPDVGDFLDFESASTIFTMPGEAVTVTANFVVYVGPPEWTLFASSTEGGSVTDPGEDVAGYGPFDDEEEVPLLAEADPGYLFVNWTGSADIDAPGSANTFITMNANASIVANFREEDAVAEPIEVKMLIRTDLYVPIYPAGGQWVADQLEIAGFDITRSLMVGSDFWDVLLGQPASPGNWNVATFGWGLSGFPRDTSTWWFVYGTDYIPWHPYEVIEAPELFDFLATKLAYKEFYTALERADLIEAVVYEYMDHSPQVLLGDVAAVRPYSPDFRCTTDAAAGFGYGWVETVHLLDVSDLPTVPDGLGDMDVLIEQYLLYEDAWNPIGGSAASADLTFLRNMLQERALMHDPEAGLRYPWHIESATLWHRSDLPIAQDASSAGWLTRTPVAEGGPDLTLPSTAWVEWDATTGQWITLAEKLLEDPEHPDTALLKTRVVYDADIFNLPMHDGSTLSLADFMLAAIIDMDRPQVDSAIYDVSTVAGYEADMEYYRGWEIVSVDPLTIDYYGMSWALDAELNITTMWPGMGDYAQFSPWHVMAVGILTEIDGDFFWSEPKVAANPGSEHMCYITGDSMPEMAGHLATAKAGNYLPYYDAIAKVYPDYDSGAGTSAVLDAEIIERYTNLDAWYTDMGHFWVSTSRVYLDEYFPTEGELVLKRFAGHTEPADRWLVEFGMLDADEAPAHTGAWVDQITVRKNVDPTVGMLKVVSGEIDFWFMLGTTDPDLIADFVDAGVQLALTFGSWTELMLNNYGPVFDDGRPNPFHYAEIREALHHIIDKEFFVEEFMAGQGTPTYALYGAAFGEYQRYPTLFDDIFNAYKYDPVRAAAAQQRIDDKMTSLGFVLDGGVWSYYP